MDTKERDQGILRDWQEGRPVGEICREHGIGQRQYYAILSKQSPPEGRIKRRGAERQPVSAVHQRIGLRLYNFYFSKSFDRTTAANKLGWSALRLRSVEQGFVDLTLFELQDIAGFLRTTVGELADG